MRYEKKMLILSGEGKGVVLMEKSALGVKFALRTFSIPAVAGLKAGVVTRSCVVVRELPSCADPSLVFYIDDCTLDLSYLHFAVFESDGSLRLYGATGRRMWESNLMDLLIRAERQTAPPAMLARSSELTPIANTPLSPLLPDPDGSGNPQLRALYGDDVIAGDNYYTPFNISSRMKEVDGFLDTPRVLDGLSPYIQKSEASHDEIQKSESPHDATAQAEDNNGEIAHDGAVVNAAQPGGTSCGSAACDTVLPNPSVAPASVKTDGEKASENIPEKEQSDAASEVAEMHDIVDSDDMNNPRSDRSTEAQPDVISEAAATVDPRESLENQDKPDKPDKLEKLEKSEKHVEPWERSAEYLRTLCTGEICVPHAAVAAVAPKAQVKRVREASFFERCRADVDKLFSSAAKDGELNAILPDIEFVKVPFDGHTVSVGRGGDVFLCYAVPGVYEKVSPLGSEAQWLPKHKNAPTGKGYWLIFQDLKSGGIIGA